MLEMLSRPARWSPLLLIGCLYITEKKHSTGPIQFEVLSPDGAEFISGLPVSFEVRVTATEAALDTHLFQVFLGSTPVCEAAVDGQGGASCVGSFEEPGTFTSSFVVRDVQGTSARTERTVTVTAAEVVDQDGDGFTPEDGDCDDTEAAVNPEEAEVPSNGRDDDCNGFVDETAAQFDGDGDGYCAEPPCLDTSNPEPDCDDTDAAFSPAAAETCFDGVDHNCNGSDNDLDAAGCSIFQADVDGDGFGGVDFACYCDALAPYVALDMDDCDDLEPDVHPDQQFYFDEPTAAGSYDYDCDGVETVRYPHLGDCDYQNFSESCRSEEGWQYEPIPACGETAPLQHSCSFAWAQQCHTGYQLVAQPCR